MEPTLPIGSVISFDRELRPEPGDVAVFMAGEQVIVHRVLARWETRRGVYYVHRGDAVPRKRRDRWVSDDVTSLPGAGSGIFAERELLGVVKDVKRAPLSGLEALRLDFLGLLAKAYAEWRALRLPPPVR